MFFDAVLVEVHQEHCLFRLLFYSTPLLCPFTSTVIKQQKESALLKAMFSLYSKDLSEGFMLIKRPFVHDSNFSS